MLPPVTPPTLWGKAGPPVGPGRRKIKALSSEGSSLRVASRLLGQVATPPAQETFHVELKIMTVKPG